ncbi:MAG: hypothetical protein Q9221_001950 [Calogaya cf. arnoldii]
MKSSPARDRSPLPFLASDYVSDGKKHLLLAASGSVATIKLPRMAEALSQHQDLSVRIVLTKAAENFLAGQSDEQPSLHYLQSIPNVDSVFVDEDEWTEPWTRGAGILHIELRRWSELLVIAPLSANSLAKMTTGLADNLLLSVVRAWDTTGAIDHTASAVKKIIVAHVLIRSLVPAAMNTAMWLHPITKKQMKILEEEWGTDGNPGGWVEVLKPVEKTLACGDAGSGAMREWTDIVSTIEQRLSLA